MENNTTTEREELFKLKVQVAQAIGQLESQIKWAKLLKVNNETIAGLKNTHEVLCLALGHPDWIDEFKQEEDVYLKSATDEE